MFDCCCRLLRVLNWANYLLSSTFPNCHKVPGPLRSEICSIYLFPSLYVCNGCTTLCMCAYIPHWLVHHQRYSPLSWTHNINNRIKQHTCFICRRWFLVCRYCPCQILCRHRLQWLSSALYLHCNITWCLLLTAASRNHNRCLCSTPSLRVWTHWTPLA